MANIKPTKKRFSYSEIYGIAVKAFRSIRHLKKGQETGQMDDKFKERIMLAVTSVNECAMCSYVHTEMALKSGLPLEDIKAFIDGEFPNVPDDQVKAIVFAQHYADMRGNPKRDMVEELLNEYGFEKACIILGVIRVIMFGNSAGIIIGSFKDRLKGGKTDPRSGVFYELMFFILMMPMVILAGLEALACDLFRVPFIKMK